MIKEIIKVERLVKGDTYEHSEVEKKSEFNADSETLLTFISKNFFGHQVVHGFRFISSEDENQIDMYYRVAVCSEQDTFDPELGEDIVLGRLIKADLKEPSLAIACGEDKKSASVMSSSVNNFIKSSMEEFAKLLQKRDSMMALYNASENMIKKSLKLSFSKYK